MGISGAEAIVRSLIDQEVQVLFGYPGGAIMPTYDALYDARDRIRHVLVRHEQGASHCAQGYARATGKTGVCLVTSGPGATNLITGLQDALMDSTPLVCISGQVFRAALGSDAFQEADIVGVSLAATKWNYQIADPAEIPTILPKAFEIARSGRPGPVMIDITKNAQIDTCEYTPAEGRSDVPIDPAGRYYRGWCYPDDRKDLSGVKSAARLINEAERPYLLVGHGVLLSGAERELIELAERAEIPIASTLLGLSAVATNHPLYVGILGMHGNYGPNLLTNQADVIIAVGMRFDDRVTGRVADYATQAKVIHIEIDPAEVDKVIATDVALIGDAREALQALLPRLERRSHADWLARFRACEAEEYERIVQAEIHPKSGPLRMGEVIERISAQTGGEATIVSDVGQHQMMAARHYGFRRPNSYITSGGLGTMGFALPAAIGAKMGAPQREVIAVIGDGGFQMTLQELGTIMQEALPVKIVILNNGYLGMVRQWQELFFDRRYSFVQMDSPDFVALAGAYGIEGEKVTERAALNASLERLLAADRPRLLEVAVGREDNVFPMMPAGASVEELRLE
jgi:acetolactate synthase-1/2/3 large subunit